jgi:hypothetical protein
MMLVLDILMLPFAEDIFCEDIRRERNNCDTKAWEEVGEHSTIREHWVSPPRVTFCPRVKQ